MNEEQIIERDRMGSLRCLLLDADDCSGESSGVKGKKPL